MFKEAYIPNFSTIELIEDEICVGYDETRYLRVETEKWNPPSSVQRQFHQHDIELRAWAIPLNTYRPPNGDFTINLSPRRDPTMPSDSLFTIPKEREPILEASKVSADDRIREALGNYVDHMNLGNQRFLSELMISIKSMRLGSKEEELDMMALYWGEGCPFALSPNHGVRNSELGMIENRLPSVSELDKHYFQPWLADEAIKDISDILRFMYFHPYCNGVGLSHICNGTLTDQDVWKLQRRIHLEAGLYHDLPTTRPLMFDEEFRAFLKYAGEGVQDPDFRNSGICGFNPRHFVNSPVDTKLDAPWIGRVGTGYCFTLSDGTQIDAAARCNASPTKTGREESELTHRGDLWRSEHIFCRKLKHGDVAGWPPGRQIFPEEKGWRWRILVYCTTNANLLMDCGPDLTHLFDDIPDFLLWCGSWFERLDMSKVLRDTKARYQAYQFS